ncbi:MAG: hypothetical protein ACRD2G_02695, partial [Terriglobia bacterium]
YQIQLRHLKSPSAHALLRLENNFLSNYAASGRLSPAVPRKIDLCEKCGLGAVHVQLVEHRRIRQHYQYGEHDIAGYSRRIGNPA